MTSKSAPTDKICASRRRHVCLLDNCFCRFGAERNETTTYLYEQIGTPMRLRTSSQQSSLLQVHLAYSVSVSKQFRQRSSAKPVAIFRITHVNLRSDCRSSTRALIASLAVASRSSSDARRGWGWWWATRSPCAFSRNAVIVSAGDMRVASGARRHRRRKWISLIDFSSPRVRHGLCTCCRQTDHCELADLLTVGPRNASH